MNEKWTIKQIPSQAGRIAVVTGANSGIGFETSVALAAAGAKVILACRNPDKADGALNQLRQRVPLADARLMTLNLASLSSVRAFVDAFQQEHSRLDLLINNAGILGTPLTRTVDGFESQMGTNHLGHFALTGLLSNTILATPRARIVTVGSLGHWRAKPIDTDDLHYHRAPYAPFAGYCKSKLANLLFAHELTRRLHTKGADVIATAAHPGGAATNISSGGKPPSALQLKIQSLVVKYLVNSAEMGAVPVLYAATAPDVAPGSYFGPDHIFGFRGHHPAPAGRHRCAKDTEAAHRLWLASSTATGVSWLD